VVVVADAGAPGAFVTGQSEVVEIVLREVIDRLPGLDEQTDRDLGTGGQPHPMSVAEVGGGCEEPVDLGVEATTGDVSPERGQFPFEEVVVAGTQLLVEHEVGDDRSGMTVSSESLFQRQSGPLLGVGPRREELPRRPFVGAVAATGGVEEVKIGAQEVGFATVRTSGCV